MKKILSWVRTHASFLLLILLGAWTGAYLLKRKSNSIGTMEAALETERHVSAIKKLQAQRVAQRPVDQAKANQILAVTAEIAEHKRRVVELHSGKPWGELSDEDIRRALLDAGL